MSGARRSPARFLLAWIGLPAALLLLLLAGAPPLADLDPGAATQAVQVGVALYVFPFLGSGLPGGAIGAACVGLPLTILARRLSAEAPLGIGIALPPLALLAAAGVARGSRRRLAAWTAAVTIAGFGLPWLDALASDFGRGPARGLAALSPVLPPGGGAPAAALLLATALLAPFLPGDPRRGSPAA